MLRCNLGEQLMYLSKWLKCNENVKHFEIHTSYQRLSSDKDTFWFVIFLFVWYKSRKFSVYSIKIKWTAIQFNEKTN